MRLAYAKGQAVDTAKDCFVYSLPEILRILDREARLEKVKTRFLVAA